MSPDIYIGAIVIIYAQSAALADDQAAESASDEDEPDAPPQPGKHHVKCPACGWFGFYPNDTRAKQALGAHKRHCSGFSPNKSPFAKPLSEWGKK